LTFVIVDYCIPENKVKVVRKSPQGASKPLGEILYYFNLVASFPHEREIWYRYESMLVINMDL